MRFPHAGVDVDEVSWAFPFPDLSQRCEHLRAWRDSHSRSGATLLVVAEVIESRTHLADVLAALGADDYLLARLHANPATLRERIIAREPDGWFGLEYLLDEMQRLHATMPSLEGVHVVLDTERLRFNRSRSPFARRVPTCSGPPHDDVTVIAPQQPCWAVDPLYRVT